MLLRIEILSWSKLVYACSTGGCGEYYSPSHSRIEVRSLGWRLETERQGLGWRPSHDSVRRSESSLHIMGPPVLLNSIIGTPGGRYMRLVISVASSICGSNRPKSPRRTVQKPSSVTFSRQSITGRPMDCGAWLASPVELRNHEKESAKVLSL